MKSFRSIRRYFRDAIHGVFRNFSLSLASISCITITLIVVAVSLILSYNVEHFSDSIRKDVTVVMFLKKETTKEDLTKIKKELESIENIASFKSLIKETPEDCQVLPNLAIEIDGIKWNKTGFTKPFGVVFAYDSMEPKTVLNYFHEIKPLNPSLMPDMIVLLKKKTIIFRLFYESEKFYVTTSNTYQGFITLPCEDDTLPIFLSYILSRTRDTRLKIADTDNMLNVQIDKYLHTMGEQSIVKFSTQHTEDN